MSIEREISTLKQVVTELQKTVRSQGLEIRTLKKGEAVNPAAWIGLKKLMELTGCKKGTAYNLSYKGKVKTRKGPGGLQFFVPDVEQFLNTKTKLKVA